MEICDKVAFITGGAGALGTAICRFLLEKGASVCLTDINDQRGKNLEIAFNQEFGQNRVFYVHCDVTKQEDVNGAFDDAIRRLGKVEIVCNNAGILSEFAVDKMVDVNLKGVLYGTMAAITRLRRDKGGPGGVIVNVASDAGVKCIWVMPSYCGVKAGVIHYTQTWSTNPHRNDMGIRFNALCPTAMHTGLAAVFPGNVLAPPQEYSSNIEYISIEEAAAAFGRLVEEDRNGDVMMVLKDGVQLVNRA